MYSGWQNLDRGTANAVDRHWANGSQGWFVSDSFQRQPIYICFPLMEILHCNTTYSIAQFYVNS